MTSWPSLVSDLINALPTSPWEPLMRTFIVLCTGDRLHAVYGFENSLCARQRNILSLEFLDLMCTMRKNFVQGATSLCFVSSSSVFSFSLLHCRVRKLFRSTA